MPSVSNVHVDAALTNLACMTRPTGFIGPRLLPDLPVQKKSDVYYTFDPSNRSFAPVDDLREPGAVAKEVDYATSTTAYLCEGHALQGVIPDEEIENADAVFNPVLDKTEFVVDRVNMVQEINAKAVIDAAISSYASDPTDEWDDYTSGDPVADMKTAINSIEDNTGLTPNVIAMDTKVWRAVKHHPDIVDRVKYTGTNDNPGDVTVQGFAQLFDLDEVIIGHSMQNSAVEGQDASLSRVWGSDVYMAYRPTRPGLKVASAGYRIMWTPQSGGREGWQVKRWYDDTRESTIVRVGKYYDQVVTMAAAWYCLQNRLS